LSGFLRNTSFSAPKGQLLNWQLRYLNSGRQKLQRTQLTGLSFDFRPAFLASFVSFSYRRKSASFLPILRPALLPAHLSACQEPPVQLLVTAGADTGLRFRIAATLTFLFLLALHGLGQIVAVPLFQDATGLAVFPEEAASATFRLVIVVANTLHQNDSPSFLFVSSQADILLSLLRPKKSGNDKAPQ
jgi:hypothetical protein